MYLSYALSGHTIMIVAANELVQCNNREGSTSVMNHSQAHKGAPPQRYR